MRASAQLLLILTLPYLKPYRSGGQELRWLEREEFMLGDLEQALTLLLLVLERAVDCLLQSIQLACGHVAHGRGTAAHALTRRAFV